MLSVFAERFYFPEIKKKRGSLVVRWEPILREISFQLFLDIKDRKWLFIKRKREPNFTLCVFHSMHHWLQIICMCECQECAPVDNRTDVELFLECKTFSFCFTGLKKTIQPQILAAVWIGTLCILVLTYECTVEQNWLCYQWANMNSQVCVCSSLSTIVLTWRSALESRSARSSNILVQSWQTSPVWIYV